MKQNLNVLVQSSDFYCPFAGVMLTSLFENNKDVPKITVYYLGSNISDENMKKLNVLFQKYGREMIYIDGKQVDEMLRTYGTPMYRGSYSPYYKLFALDMINDDIDQLLYIDSDIIINNSLKSITDIDLNDKTLAMCYDLISEKYKQKLGITGGYYNTGVILIDCKRWKENKCCSQIIDHMKNVHASYPIVEQDMLNILFNDSIQVLHLKYNLIADIMLYNDCDWVKSIYGIEKYYDRSTFDEALKSPAVIHCFAAVTNKPWYKNSGHPVSELWDKYLKISPWKDFAYLEGKLAFKRVVNRVMYKTLPKSLYAFGVRNITDILLNIRLKKCGL